MKKVLILALICCFLFAPLLFLNSYALEQGDLVKHGVPYVCAAPSATNACVDGKILPSEYSIGNGVQISANPSPQEIVHYAGENIKENLGIFISYDSENLYIGATISDSSSLGTVEIDGDYAFSFTVRIGMNSSFPAALSCFENKYFFSPNNFDCIAALGTRAVFFEGEKAFVGSISSITPESESPYCQGDVIWNGEKYRTEAVLAMTSDSPEVVFECRIPWGDLLQIAPDVSMSNVIDNPSSLCGGFSFGTYLKGQSMDSSNGFFCGILSDDLCSFSDNHASWREYLSDSFQLKNAMIPDVLLLPLYFDEHPDFPEKNPVLSEKDESGGEKNEGEPLTPSVTDSVLLNPTTESVPKSTKDIFEGLPSLGEEICENSEIQYIKPESSVASGKGGVGSTLLLIAGIFLFASVVVTAIILRSMDEKEKNSKDKKKTSKKS